MKFSRWTTVAAAVICASGWVCNVSAQEAVVDADPQAAQEQADIFTGPENTDSDVANKQTVSVGDTGEIDLHVKDLEIAKVLQLLSIQAQRNIVLSRNVAGNISADLYSVDFYEALDAILHTNGFGYREKGSFIYVYTQQELAALEEAERQVVTRVRRLNYLNAADASTFVSPMLSNNGTISVSAEPTDSFVPEDTDAGRNDYAAADTLIIRDYPENVEEIMAILAELDVRPEQVLIEATVLQARLSEANAFGVDFSIFTDLNIGDFNTPLNAVDQLISGSVTGADSAQTVQTTVGDTNAGQSGMKLGFLGNEVAVFVRALDSVTDTTVLSNPKLLVLNRQRAQLLVGARLGYLSTTATDTSTTQTVEFLDVGTELAVRPFVSSDGNVRIEMRPSVSDGETSLVGGFVIPNETTQEMITNVIVRSGQTVVLGGLFTEDINVTRSQVPVVGDVPILGNAFQGQDDTVSRTEIIFMIKPTIVKDKALYAAGESASEGIELARIGAREGLLPFSRTKLTASHVRNAMKQLDDGNEDKALWYADMALYLDPTSVEAWRIKEEVTGKRVYYPTQSVMHEAINAMVDQELGDDAPQTQPEPMDEEAAAEAELLDALGQAEPAADTTEAKASTTTQANESVEPAEPVVLDLNQAQQLVETAEQEKDELEAVVEAQETDPAVQAQLEPQADATTQDQVEFHVDSAPKVTDAQLAAQAREAEATHAAASATERASAEAQAQVQTQTHIQAQAEPDATEALLSQPRVKAGTQLNETAATQQQAAEAEADADAESTTAVSAVETK